MAEEWDMGSKGRHGVKVDKAWRDRSILDSDRLPDFRGEEAKVRGNVSDEENED